jgi:ankyrin repeat protein
MLMPVQLDVRLWACMRVRLIEGGAFSHACFCRNGVVPIHCAARGGHSSTVEALIAKKADVNARDK